MGTPRGTLYGIQLINLGLRLRACADFCDSTDFSRLNECGPPWRCTPGPASLRVVNRAAFAHWVQTVFLADFMYLGLYFVAALEGYCLPWHRTPGPASLRVVNRAAFAHWVQTVSINPSSLGRRIRRWFLCLANVQA